MRCGSSQLGRRLTCPSGGGHGTRQLRLLQRMACIVGAILGAVGISTAGEPYGRFQFDDSQREHWAFVAPVRPELPEVSDTSWVRTPIDGFILAKLDESSIKPAPPADRRVLLRRVHLDLIGLPPTIDEQRAFLADNSPEAYARVVDDLLSRPQYGERWARHWLDVVRYAESNGYERDNPKPNVWRYRDWVVDALNADKPYDQFMIEQLAGDELEGSDAAAQIATSFLRLGTWDDEPADAITDRYDQLDDVLGTTAATFMAATIRCARCHDHKFEPFSQVDYTRLLAIFEPLKRPQAGRDDLDRFVGTAEAIAAYEASKKEADTQVAERKQQIDQLEAQIRERLLERIAAAQSSADLPPDVSNFSAEIVAAFRKPPADRDEAQKKLVADHKDKFSAAVTATTSESEKTQLASWHEEIKSIDAARQPEPTRGYIWYEEPGNAPMAHVFPRGNAHAPGQEVEPGFPAVLVDAAPPAPTATARSSGRRLQFARWLAEPNHPLTARVIANRVWQHHFGDGLVGTESDFGVMGEAPTHQELLDWLATELVQNGWRLKHLHRLILLSNTYQQAAASNPAAEENDVEVNLLWRWPARRLEAEVVRDQVLATSGALNLERGGPSVFPVVSEAVLASQSRPGSGWGKSDPRAQARRSLYVFVKRTLPIPELEVLDAPNTNQGCEQRVVSTVAPQALTYLNGKFMSEQAALLAERLRRETAGPPDSTPEQQRGPQIDRLFELTLCRLPTEPERQALAEFLSRQRAQIAADEQAAGRDGAAAEQKALESLCLVVLNSNEFFYWE